MKNKSKYTRMLLCIFFISMLVLIMPLQNAGASSLTINVGFEVIEGGGAGQQFPIPPKTSILNTHLKSTIFVVTTGSKRTGDNGFHAQGTGWWNFSYASDEYITAFKTFMNVGTLYDVHDTHVYFYFYNKTIASGVDISTKLGTSANLLKYIMVGIQIEEYKTSGTPYTAYQVGHIKSDGTWYMPYNNGLTASGFDYFKFEIYNPYGYCNYTHSIDGTTVYQYSDDTVCNTTAVIENYRIDACYIIGDIEGNCYFDDVSITKSDSYAGSGAGPSVGCIDTTGLTQVGYFGSCVSDSPSQYISKTYNVPVTTTILGVELQLGYDQIGDDGNIANYDLKINGMDIGMPTCDVLLSSYGIMQWVTNMTITNNVVNFEFYHSLKTGSRYWTVGTGCDSTTDLDGDGSMFYVQTRGEVTYEWRWFWIFPYQAPVYDAYATTVDRDLAVRWWCNGFPPPEGITYNYTDTLGLSKYEFENATGYVYNLSKGYDTIFGGYTLSDPLATYTLSLFIDGAEYTSDYYPITCRYPGSSFGFAPVSAGNYTFILYKDAVETANVTAWVTGTLGNFVIRTNPPVTDQYQKYQVLWRYYESHGYPGYIGMSSLVREALNKYSDLEFTLPSITANTTGSYLFDSYSSNAEYWGMYAYANSVHTKVAETTHTIRIPSIFSNSIKPLFPSITLGGDEVFEIEHMFPGADVRVYVNDVFIRNVGDSQHQTVSYTPNQAGPQFAHLILYQDGSTVLLASCNFTVTYDIPGPTEDNTFGLSSLIPENMRILVAIAIIVGFAFMPFAVIYTVLNKLKGHGIELHIPTAVMMVLTIITSITGYFLTIMWGLMPWWTLFGLLFILIIIFAIFYYTRKNESND